MELRRLVRSDAKILEIARHLDGLDPAARLAETRALGGAEQKRLYQKAAEAPRLDLEYFVPARVGRLSEVIHHGRNSQPAFRLFQKRWCRPEDRDDVLHGYNEAPIGRLIGPGYFVARETAGRGSDPRGAIVVDYFLTPRGAMPPGWPRVRPNTEGLQRFVYGNTRDYMRRVSAHVSIGEAHRKEKQVMGWFVLCREDRGEDAAR